MLSGVYDIGGYLIGVLIKGDPTVWRSVLGSAVLVNALLGASIGREIQ